MIKKLILLTTATVLVGCNATQSNNSNHLICADTWVHREHDTYYFILAISKLIQKLDSGDEAPPQDHNQTNEEHTTGHNPDVTPCLMMPPGGYYRNSLWQIEPINPNFAGYYRSSTGESIPIRKPGTAILPTDDPIAIGDMYLNPDTGLMTLIEIQWPIQ